MELTPRQRRALDGIVETFCPSGDGFPTPSELGVTDALLQALDGNPREPERKRQRSATLLDGTQQCKAADQQEQEE